MLTVIYIMVSAQVNYKRGRGPQTSLDDILNSALPRMSFHPGSGADVGAGAGAGTFMLLKLGIISQKF